MEITAALVSFLALIVAWGAFGSRMAPLRLVVDLDDKLDKAA